MTLATLSGFPIIADQPVAWDIVSGVTESRGNFVFPNADADSIFQKHRGGVAAELFIDPDGFDSLRIKNLFVISTGPTSHEETTTVEVVDLRFWWSRIHISRAYNVPRKTGDRFRLQREGDRIEVAPIVDEIAYAKWSLRDGVSAWTAKEMLEDILDEMSDNTPGGFDYEIGDVESLQLPTQDVVIDDDGGSALKRVLSLLPGASLYVDRDGVVQVFDARDGSEVEVLDAQAPAIVGGALYKTTDLSAIRPSAVQVLFTKEVETRFDAHEGETLVEDTRTLENVIPVPDVSIDIPGLGTVATGTYVNIEQYVDAINAEGLRPGQTVAINLDLLRDTWFVPGLFQALIQLGQVQPDVVLARRISALRQHYRQTYRVADKFLDRISSIRPYRVAILDPVTNTRAPAVAYTDWTVFFTIRAALTHKEGVRLAESVEGYDADLSNATVAPVQVGVVDEQQGILRFNWVGDPFGDVFLIAPGASTGAGALGAPPEADPRNLSGTGFLSQELKLTSDFDLATIVTCVYGSPNNNDRFHVETVTPDDASAALPGRPDLGDAFGPVWTIRIGPEVETARFAWQDAEADAIDSGIGIIEGALPIEPIDTERLRSVAVAAAAALYASFVDRGEGGARLPLSRDLTPSGNMLGVRHELSPTGEAATVVALPQELPGVDMMAVLPESVRRQVLGLVGSRDRTI